MITSAEVSGLFSTHFFTIIIIIIINYHAFPSKLKVAKATVDTTSIIMTRWLLLSKFLHDSSLGHDLRLGAFLLLQDPLQVIIKMMNEDSNEYRW